jgi:hypothetical protein
MDRVTQAVTTGSPLLALKKKFITVDELLGWLVTAPMSDRTLVAYRAACQITSPDDHYIEDRHFLSGVRAPEYGAIFILSGGDIETPIYKNKPKEQLIQYVAPALARMHTDSTFERKMKLICDKSGVPVRYLQENRSLLFQCHTSNLIREYLAKTNQGLDSHAQMIIESDYFDALAVADQLVEPLMARCQTLISTAPQYWEAVAKPDYRDFFNKLIAAKKLAGSTKAQALDLDQIFPGIFGVTLSRLSDLAYKVTCLDFTVQAYVLGFPIQYGLPSQPMIENLLYYLSTVGKDRYAQDLKEYEERMANGYLNGETNGWHQVPWQVRNTQDVLENSVYEYNSFDRIMLITGSNIHQFVRLEFPNLLKSHKNIWTNEDLPKHFETELQARLAMADDLKLPTAGTIQELLTKIDEGTLYPPESTNNNQLGAGSAADNLLQLLFGSGMSNGTTTLMPGVTLTTSSSSSPSLEQLMGLFLGRN